jgi:hypothetical protein
MYKLSLIKSCHETETVTLENFKHCRQPITVLNNTTTRILTLPQDHLSKSIQHRDKPTSLDFGGLYRNSLAFPYPVLYDSGDQVMSNGRMRNE